MNHWTIELWENRNGVCYVEKDLLEKMERLLKERLFKRMGTLTKYTVQNAKSSDLLEDLGGGLLELKFKLPNAQIRFLGLISYKDGSIPVFHALSAFRKKDQKIRVAYIKKARDRQKEFEKNN